jgi:hypothetical protein
MFNTSEKYRLAFCVFTEHDPSLEVAKNGISGGLGPSEKKCPQPSWIFPILSQKFKHITKQLL